VESLRSSIGETEAFMTRGDLARCLSIAQPQNFLNVERDDNNFTGSNIAMAVDNSLESLLATLTTSIQSATEALPQDDILPPKEGISLLDVKNELLLSYLQNLVFLILLKLRARSSGESDQLHPHDEVVQKLVELRIYLEKGVRPLENRLKYNIDKIIRSADDAARRTAQVTAKPKPKKTRNDTGSGSDESDAESAASDQTADSEDEMAYAPNKAAVVRAEQEQPSARDRESAKDGIYRPPKITPMAMPTTEGRAERRDRRPNKSATLDEFIATELSSAPIAEPSIGSTITQSPRRSDGRRMRDASTKSPISHVWHRKARKRRGRRIRAGVRVALAVKSGGDWAQALIGLRDSHRRRKEAERAVWKRVGRGRSRTDREEVEVRLVTLLRRDRRSLAGIASRLGDLLASDECRFAGPLWSDSHLPWRPRGSSCLS
jgi:U3 small nucleolar ribonucleoprotein protein LCP5